MDDKARKEATEGLLKGGDSKEMRLRVQDAAALAPACLGAPP